LLVTWPIDAQADTVLSAEIVPQTLAQALEAFAKQTGLQVVYLSDLAIARLSKGAQAGLSSVDALTQLLEDTGLTFRLLNARTVMISAIPMASAPAMASTQSRKGRTKRAIKPTDQVVVTGSSGQGDHLVPMEDVRIIPASVTVLEGESLAIQKLDQMSDYAAYLPGLNLDTAGVPSGQVVILRGIASLSDASSITYYIDDITLTTHRSARAAAGVMRAALVSI
jgi:iron complex outermembrane recepter protein